MMYAMLVQRQRSLSGLGDMSPGAVGVLGAGLVGALVLFLAYR